ncbi:MAG: thiazole synthase [Spirochaetota bacterium]|nr:thiazole synthase [Spirochaetota bacterium]
MILKNLELKDDYLIISDRKFNSRLFIGTGKYSSIDIMKEAIEESESEMVTVALRRVDLKNPNDDLLGSLVNNKRIKLLPNTSGARNAEEAIRLSRIAREMGCGNWVKLEVTPEPRYLLPDPIETEIAAKTLVKDGFVVLPYINADPILAKRLEEVGCATVMPLGSPIGTNKGIKTLDNIKIIIEMSNVPVVVDAGLGTPSHAAQAMELGADAVLVNTAIAVSQNPSLIARAFKKGVEAGREAYIAGQVEISDIAISSSPLTGFLR